MKIKLICIGKTNKSFLIEGENEYLKRLKKYCPFEKIELSDVKNAKKLTQNQIKTIEGIALMKLIKPNDHVILLDENGKSFDSVGFSKFLQKKFNTVNNSLIFVVGGPYGFSEDLHQRSNDKLSLSEMTFSHQMIRMLFIEQIYRAFTILKGEPYHHQ